jgi:tetratricopeptide (TPR) repeat protein
MKKILFGTLLFLFLSFDHSTAFADPALSQKYSDANKLFSRAKYSEALPLYQGVLVSPASGIPVGKVYARIGDCYFRLGNYANALPAYRNALQNQKPDDQPSTQYWIGFCSFLLNKNSEAVAELLKIPERYPGSGMWVATAYYWAGRASERMGKKEQAVEYYRKAGGKGTSTQGQFAMKKAEAIKKGPGSSSQGPGMAGPDPLNP